MLIDSHAHLEASTSSVRLRSGLRGASVEDLENVIERAKKNAVGKIVTIGTSLDASKKAIDIAEKYSRDDLQIYATAGLHPKDAKGEIVDKSLYQCINTLKKIAKSSKKVIAIGECGLDYITTTEATEWRTETTKEEKVFQRKLFVEQIKLAGELNLPLVIHCRNGWGEIFDLLSNVKGQLSNVPNGVFHSWTGSWNAAKKALDLGFYISFSGIVTFKNAAEIQDVARKMPLNRMLIETDSPFLAPDPVRGGKNEPKNVRIVAQFIAGIRNQTVDEISSKTSANAGKLFNLL